MTAAKSTRASNVNANEDPWLIGLGGIQAQGHPRNLSQYDGKIRGACDTRYRAVSQQVGEQFQLERCFAPRTLNASEQYHTAACRRNWEVLAPVGELIPQESANSFLKPIYAYEQTIVLRFESNFCTRSPSSNNIHCSCGPPVKRLEVAVRNGLGSLPKRF